MVTIQPGYMSTQGFSASMSNKDTILAIGVNTDTSNPFIINVSTRTRSTQLQSHD